MLKHIREGGRSIAPPIGRLGAEANAQIAVLTTDIYDLAEVHPHWPFLGLEIVPASVAECLVELLELLLGDAQREYLAALEADAHAPLLLGDQGASIG